MAKSIIQVLLQRYWRVSRGLLLSVAAVLRDTEGRVLLCRETAGANPAWHLPRGDVHSGEDVEGALRRTLAEGGLPMPIDRATAFAIYADQSRSRADHVTVLTAVLAAPPEPQRRASLEWQWFPIDALPVVIDPPSRRRIEEVKARRDVEELW